MPGLIVILLYVLLVAVALFFGMRWAKAPRDRLLRIPALLIPTVVGAIVLVGVLEWLLSSLPRFISASIELPVVFASSALVGFWRGSIRSRVGHQRGTRIIDGSRTPMQGQDIGLTLGGQPVPRMDESKHFKLIGTTGTGKSTAIRELLRGAIARGDRAVIADPDGSYMRSFYDPARGDVILNPFDSRSARWDLFAEILQLHDADQLARSFIPDREGADRNWRSYAHTFLTAVLRQLHRQAEGEDLDLGHLYYLLMMAPPSELRDLLEGTPAATYLGQDNGKFFESVRSVAATQLTALEHVARQESGTPFSVRRWIREGKGILFLPYKASEIAALHQIISTWMRLAIFEAMNAEEGDQRLWFVVDELDALGQIDGLKDALARLRKFGGRCILGFQSIAQVRGLYGDADAQTIVENCGNSLILRCSTSERGGTAEYVSRLIGKREIIRQQSSKTFTGFLGGRQSSRTMSDHYATEDAVMASEIEQLPDLHGFLKVASAPEWRRVRLSDSRDH